MKFFNIFLILVGLTCSFTDGEIRHYSLEINENGTTFSEGIEIDEEQKVEIFRVPAHNDVPAADFYNDFEMGLTLIKIFSEKVCYITKMDPSLPSPQKLKEDIRRANSQRGSLPSSTKPNLLKPTGPAHRPYLTKEMLAFCGALPIYKADVSPMNTANSGEQIIWSEPRRDTRQTRQVTVFSNYTACDPKNMLDKVAACMQEDWNLNCRLQPGNCYFYVSCRVRKPGKDVWLCERTHLTFPTPVCCELICPPPSSTPPTPAS